MTNFGTAAVTASRYEMHPSESPRVISENGPQFIAKDFKEFIRLTGMTHVRTAPFYPQPNGKLERYHKPRSYQPHAQMPPRGTAPREVRARTTIAVRTATAPPVRSDRANSPASRDR